VTPVPVAHSSRLLTGSATIRRVLDRLSRRAGLVLAGVAMSSFIGAAAVSILAGIPKPQIHDEFSNLLAADTYSRMRLANPPHPEWRHFESIHIIQQPTYASKYPPAQGLILALGQLAGGHPIVGVWLSSVLMCTAIAWMLQQWLPPRWSLVGAILAVLQFGICGYWAQSYWGGAIAAAGGALLFGAIRRLGNSRALSTSVALGVGLALLAFSRPFEGLVIAVPAGLMVLRATSMAAFRREKIRLIGPALAILVVAGAFGLRLNSAVTGHWARSAYVEHHEQYDVAPLFIWQAQRPVPDYASDRVREFHLGWELDQWKNQQSLSGWFQTRLKYSFVTLIAFGAPPPELRLPAFGEFALFPFLLISILPTTRKVRFAWGMIALVVLALSTATYFGPHYLAPITSLLVYLTVVGMRTSAIALRNHPSLRGLLVPVALVAALGGTAYSAARFVKEETNAAKWWNQKAEIERELQQRTTPSVVFVRYEPGQDIQREWVYNSAAVDEQHVVWAHDMGAVANESLRNYFADRTAWLLLLARNGQHELRQLSRD